jgi:hypothetical protein
LKGFEESERRRIGGKASATIVVLERQSSEWPT